eukprot:10821474-Heterocapsa_arctica.AAC.1
MTDMFAVHFRLGPGGPQEKDTSVQISSPPFILPKDAQRGTLEKWGFKGEYASHHMMNAFRK